MSFGTRLRERREFLNISRAELASALGVTVSAIGNYENGVSSPKEEILYRIFSVLKVDPNYLWQDEIQPSSESFICSFPEQELIKKYRALDEHGKEATEAILELEYRRCRPQKYRPVQIAALGGKTIDSSKLDEEIDLSGGVITEDL